MGVENRRETRVRAHWGIELRWAEGSANGLTENLSPRGAMLSVEDEPPLSTGEKVIVSLRLPDGVGAVEMDATVRWVSEMLPNTLGIEFDEPLPQSVVDALEALPTAATG